MKSLAVMYTSGRETQSMFANTSHRALEHAVKVDYDDAEVDEKSLNKNLKSIETPDLIDVSPKSKFISSLSDDDYDEDEWLDEDAEYESDDEDDWDDEDDDDYDEYDEDDWDDEDDEGEDWDDEDSFDLDEEDWDDEA